MSDAAAPSSRGGRLARLSPAHGWRSFWTEIAIVVLGVLIALGAQQAVDTWHSRSDVADFRAALDRELAFSLAAYRDRVEQSGCVARKLDQLDAWQRGWQDGTGPAATGPLGRPYAYGLATSVWRTGAGGIVGRMPLDQRLAYATLYSAFDNYADLRLREIDTWFALYGYDGARRLSDSEARALRGYILAARSIDASIRVNFPGLIAEAAALGVRPAADRAPANDSGLCAPLVIAARS